MTDKQLDEGVGVELKPCAHCGSTATAMQNPPRWWVECDGCGMNTPTDNFGDPVKAWNTRASGDEAESEDSGNEAKNLAVPRTESKATPALDANFRKFCESLSLDQLMRFRGWLHDVGAIANDVDMDKCAAIQIEYERVRGLVDHAYRDAEGWVLFDANGEPVEWPEHWPQEIDKEFLTKLGVEIRP